MSLKDIVPADGNLCVESGLGACLAENTGHIAWPFLPSVFSSLK